jgi:hypothetical protein
LGLKMSVIAKNWEGWTDISNAGHSSTLEFPAIQLFYCGLEVRCSLKLDEASGYVRGGLRSAYGEYTDPLPSRSRPVSEYTTSRLD